MNDNDFDENVIEVVESSFLEGLEALQVYHDSIKAGLDYLEKEYLSDEDIEDIQEQYNVVGHIISLLEGSAKGYGVQRHDKPTMLN